MSGFAKYFIVSSTAAFCASGGSVFDTEVMSDGLQEKVSGIIQGGMSGTGMRRSRGRSSSPLSSALDFPVSLHVPSDLSLRLTGFSAISLSGSSPGSRRHLS
ncbi:hypothetical protein ElyMa_002490300 [Elysia marginata]|uniref:Secreted protein n=1 Tax=Elysia marginata TaxID=1093978 RepID=A0AAV4GQ64_9GAST|nr:hypothetical protein ElyMa_002490300 [Elysia marginata]